jgi:alpha-tubulin suppressor-like RCC1 family protein
MARRSLILGIGAAAALIAACGSGSKDTSSPESGAGSGSSSGNGSGSGSNGGSSGSSGGSGGAPSGCESGTCATTVTAVAAGGSQTCALLSSGTVECWGDNTTGDLGDGTSTGPQTATFDGNACSTTPVAVSGLSGVTSIAAGQSHTCAVLSGGTVECWGDDTDGELGDGTGAGTETCNGQPCSTTPVAVPGLSGVTAITAGDYFTCALLSGGGTVECWGFNYHGQLGSGSTAPESATPVAVSGLSGATAISAAFDHACALLSGGTVECWGNNSVGELGTGTNTGPQTCGNAACSTTPIAVSGLSGVTAVAAGGNSTCALLSGGTVECWGDNSYGELGDGMITGPQTCPGDDPCSMMPVAVTGLSGVTAISVGGDQVCALLAGGSIKCWGGNEIGELGNGTSDGPQTCTVGGNPNACSGTPVAVSGLTGATAVYAGADSQTCALLRGGIVECWGDNLEGELGDGTSAGPQLCSGISCSTTPVAVSGL